MFPSGLLRLAEVVLAECRSQEIKLATAESCTGGLIIACLTEVNGASRVVDRGFITYSNESKRDLLGVPGDLIMEYGAVSEPVVRAMAEGALHYSDARISVAVTGIAGPGGGTPKKPVGTVHFASARQGRNIIHDEHHFGDIGRAEVRLKSVEVALQLMQKHL